MAFYNIAKLATFLGKNGQKIAKSATFYEKWSVMASTKTVSKGIRITNEAAEYFKDKPVNRMIECMIPLLESGELAFDGESLKISGNSGVHTKYTDIVEEFDEMASCSGISLDDLVGGIFTLLEDGTLMIENGSIVVSSGWASEFESVCHDLCIPVEKAAEGAIKALKRGGL